MRRLRSSTLTEICVDVSEHARLARHAARHRHGRFVRALQRAPQRAFDLADALAVGDRRAVVFEHVIEVEAEAVGGRRDARVDDVESQLVEHRGRAREAVL